MKIIVKILMVAVFFVLVFIPRSVVGVIYYWLLFPVLFILVAFYFYLLFYVSKKMVTKALKTSDYDSFLVSMVPLKEENEFVHGRLVVYNGMVLLYSREKGKVKMQWSTDLASITFLNFKKVGSNKKGFVISTATSDVEFACRLNKEKQADFIRILGLETEEE